MTVPRASLSGARAGVPYRSASVGAAAALHVLPGTARPAGGAGLARVSTGVSGFDGGSGHRRRTLERVVLDGGAQSTSRRTSAHASPACSMQH